MSCVSLKMVSNNDTTLLLMRIGTSVQRQIVKAGRDEEPLLVVSCREREREREIRLEKWVVPG